MRNVKGTEFGVICTIKWIICSGFYAFDMILSVWFFCMKHYGDFRVWGCRMLAFSFNSEK